MILTEEGALSALRMFFREKPFLFFGTGMSCALDTGFSMAALRDVLVDRMQRLSLADTQRGAWEAIAAELRNGVDLESALNGATDSGLIREITRIAGEHVAGLDCEYGHRIARGSVEWPATRLLEKLVATLPEGDRILHVLTPNYDMLFEHACDSRDIPYANGFWGGIQRTADWDAVDRALLTPVRVPHGRGMKTVYKRRRHVRLYKVHGSLNYFFHRAVVIENDAWMWAPPSFAERVLVTPGLSKYETLQRYRQELLQTADAAIGQASHFLFLGYGFNDNHLEEYIKRKLIAQSCDGLIVTRDSNPRIESLLAEATNLWLVCKTVDPNLEGTRIFNRQYSDWLVLPTSRLWDVAEFTRQVLGG